MLNTTLVAGLKVTAATKKAVITEITHRLEEGKQTFIITPYSEFLLESLKHKEILAILNKADISIADGIAILWAARFLAIPLTAKNFYGKILQAFWQMVYSGAGILLRPNSIKQQIPEKIVGADFFWDLAQLAHAKKYSIYLAGGYGDTAKHVATILQQKYPGLTIAGTSNILLSENFETDGSANSLVQEIKELKPDFVFAAFGPIKQEKFIAAYFPELPIRLAIGLGGTFDYVTGEKSPPPSAIRKAGLEWGYRLITQPVRIKRIWNATFSLIEALIRYKVFCSFPYRANVVCVLIKNGHVLLCKRKVNREDDTMFRAGNAKNIFANYWQFPQGGMNPQEELEATARRELYEEISVEHAIFIAQSKATHAYEWSNGVRPLLNNHYRFKGQNQRVAYFEFTGDDAEITVDNAEFEAWKWVPLQELLSVIHEERKPLAEIVLNDVRHLDLLKKAFKNDKI